MSIHSNQISGLRGGEASSIIPSGISRKIFALDNAFLLYWSWFNLLSDLDFSHKFYSEEGISNDHVADVTSYLQGRKDQGPYFGLLALNMLNRNMMLSAEPEDTDKLKRTHFVNAFMYAATVLQV